MKVLILGVNGFIGSNLIARILKDTDWEVFGMDVNCNRVEAFTKNPRFKFYEGDISINKEWIEYRIRRSDVCLPLVAIATPALYVKKPLEVFRLDFEENLRIIRQCAEHGTRVIFPSTSEVYGKSADTEFDEQTSDCVYGPISKQRWIYACSKQLLDRVIWAMGVHQKLRFSIIRPFNWIGPGLDDINSAKEGSSRVVTQFLGHLMRREPIRIVGDGAQRRAYTYIDDGVEALMRIIENKNGACDGQIFNIGNPKNDLSINELVEKMIAVLSSFPGFQNIRREAVVEHASIEDYYGKDYEDISHRVPSIRNARERLGWSPRVDMETALYKTIEHYATGGA